MAGGEECNTRKEVNVQFWPKVGIFMAKIFQNQNLLKKSWSLFKHPVAGINANRALLVYIHKESHGEFWCQLPKSS